MRCDTHVWIKSQPTMLISRRTAAVAAQAAQVDFVRLAQQTPASCMRFAAAVSLPGSHELIRSWTPVAMQHPSLSMCTVFQ